MAGTDLSPSLLGLFGVTQWLLSGRIVQQRITSEFEGLTICSVPGIALRANGVICSIRKNKRIPWICRSVWKTIKCKPIIFASEFTSLAATSHIQDD